MKSNPINWFAIPVTNLDRAHKFYSAVFSCELNLSEREDTQMALFPSDMAATGAGGMLIKNPSSVPSSEGTIVYFHVDDINTILDKVTKNEGKVLLPKTSIGKNGFIAQFLDSEGNRVALHTLS